ncbi:MAG: maleylpyruvate isomerase family mycothiol-dependent enzyme [Acidimicrobiia bacterium]|nr:maleylpyruvate isomerase family mycothiol-dependent enzyme [Acidimicrobiia bacterium]
MSSEGDLEIIRAEGTRLADVAESAPHAVIEIYRWDLTGLVVHTGRVHRRTTEILSQRRTERISRPPAPETGIIEWFREGVEEMCTAIAETPEDVEVFTFGMGDRASFWLDRMLLETVVHRWDAENAAGEPSIIPTDLARRGIEEFSRMWAGLLAPHEKVTFEAEDSGDAWSLISEGDGSRLVPGKGTANITDTASNLYLWLMGRIGLDAPETVTAAIAGLSRPPN